MPKQNPTDRTVLQSLTSRPCTANLKIFVLTVLHVNLPRLPIIKSIIAFRFAFLLVVPGRLLTGFCYVNLKDCFF